MTTFNKVMLAAAPFLTAAAEALVEYLATSGGLTKDTIVHALGAAVLADLALLKQMSAPKGNPQ